MLLLKLENLGMLLWWKI